MERDIWFGTRSDMRWVPEFKLDTEWGRDGTIESGAYLDGLGYVNRTPSSHRTYNLNFGVSETHRLQIFSDYYSGIRGDGPVYFIDPTTTGNILPAWWAAPYMGIIGSPWLFPGIKPTVATTPVNTYDLPVRGASYNLNALPSGAQSRDIFLPIAPGTSIFLGARAELVNCAMMVDVIGSGGIVLETYEVPVGGMDGNPYRTQISGGAGRNGIRVYFQKGLTEGESSATIYAIQTVMVDPVLTGDIYPFVLNNVLYTLGTPDGVGVAIISVDEVGDGYGVVYIGDVPGLLSGAFIGGRGATAFEFAQAPFDVPVGGRPGLATMSFSVREVIE